MDRISYKKLKKCDDGIDSDEHDNKNNGSMSSSLYHIAIA
jgi:hypothetical protein